MNQILIQPEQPELMLQVAPSETTVPCPKCRKDMALAVVIPHPVTPQLARHTYLCTSCNQTKTYILPVASSPDSATTSAKPAHITDPLNSDPDGCRKEPRSALAAPATIYDKDGSFLLPCTIRDLSRSGARLELFKESILPQYFLLSMLPDGSGRRLCSKVWQLSQVAGVRFAEEIRA